MMAGGWLAVKDDVFFSARAPIRLSRQCQLEADGADAVKAVNDEAGIPYTRIVEAHDLTPA